MKNTDLKPDGERMIPEFHKGKLIYGEHINRYEAVLSLCKDKIVLDIASGSGYGTKMISTVASKVYGVDISEDAVNYSKLNYNSKNIHYKMGDGHIIPLEDSSVDLVVSMETIEHIEDQDHHLLEIQRVLKPDGIYICSTPNDKVYPKGNHFHVKEHSSKSLDALLGKYFKTRSFNYQFTDYTVSTLSSEELKKEFDEKRRVQKYIQLDSEDCIYFMVVCSNSPKVPKIKPIHTISEKFSYPYQVEVNEALRIGRLDSARVHTLEKTVAKMVEEIDSIKLSRIYRYNSRLKKLLKFK